MKNNFKLIEKFLRKYVLKQNITQTEIHELITMICAIGIMFTTYGTYVFIDENISKFRETRLQKYEKYKFDECRYDGFIIDDNKQKLHMCKKSDNINYYTLTTRQMKNIETRLYIGKKIYVYKFEYRDANDNTKKHKYTFK